SGTPGGWQLHAWPRAGCPWAESIEDVVAAVHVQRGTSNGAGTVAGQEGAQRTDVIDAQRAAHRRARRAVGDQRIEVAQPGGGAGRNGAGRNGVDADAGGAEFGGEIARG